MSRKFGVLRFIGTVYKVIGIILAVIAVLTSLAVCVTSIAGGYAFGEMSRQMGMQDWGMVGPIGGIIAGAGILIGMGLAAISQYAIGEAIFLFLAIEENTRATAALIQRQQARAESEQ